MAQADTRLSSKEQLDSSASTPQVKIVLAPPKTVADSQQVRIGGYVPTFGKP